MQELDEDDTEFEVYQKEACALQAQVCFAVHQVVQVKYCFFSS